MDITFKIKTFYKMLTNIEIKNNLQIASNGSKVVDM